MVAKWRSPADGVVGLGGLTVQACNTCSGNSFESYILVTLSILPSMYVACPLTRFNTCTFDHIQMKIKGYQESPIVITVTAE